NLLPRVRSRVTRIRLERIDCDPFNRAAAKLLGLRQVPAIEVRDLLNWHEPTLEDILSDSIIKAVMKADGPRQWACRGCPWRVIGAGLQRRRSHPDRGSGSMGPHSRGMLPSVAARSILPSDARLH